MRREGGLGISEVTDSLVIVVSEETGQISIAENGIMQKNIPSRLLRKKLEEDYS